MTEFEITEDGIFEEHEHDWKNVHDYSGIRLSPGNIRVEEFCRVCGITRVSTGFFDGKWFSSNNDSVLSEYDINDLELLELDNE